MSATSRQVTLNKGQFLCIQGQPSDSFFVLKKGALEVLFCEDLASPTEADVAAKARRIAILDQTNTPVGEIGALEGTPRSASLRALEPCELIWVAGGQRAIVEWVSGNIQAGLLIARNLMNRVLQSHGRWNEIEGLTRRVSAYTENFTVLYTIFNTRPASASPAFAGFLQQGRQILAQVPPGSTPSLGNVDRNVPAEIPAPLDEPFPEIELCHFMSHILKQPDVYLTWLVSPGTPHPLMFITSKLTDALPRISRALHDAMKNFETAAAMLFGASGLVQAFIHLHGTMNADQRESLRPYLEKLLAITTDVRGRIEKIWGETFPDARRVAFDVEQLGKLVAGRLEPTEPSAETESPSVVADFNLAAALGVLSLDPAEKDLVEICLGLRGAEPPQVYNAYWKIYSKIWRANLKDEKPELTAFLRFGIASPTPIARPDKFNLGAAATGPVLYADQWLKRIYNRESPVSRNDLGQTYEELLKDAKQTRYKPDEPDPNMDLVCFEVEQMMARAARAFSAGRGEIALLRRTEPEIAEYAATMATPAKVAESLIRVIRTDYTAFMRDVRVLLSERSEFLPKEVLPFIILLPASGERSICWQEFEGRSKETPGRMLLPLLSSEDFFDLIIGMVARFRWDIAKSIAGADWMNPADGGLSGRYYDYASFYKKNTELSDEQKEKLAEQFANVTLDADKFSIEYALWIKFESQGIQKLNRVSRRILAEFCPFNMEIRKRLVRQPAFTEILRKDSNRRLKRKQEIERRIYKLEKDGVSIGGAFDAAMRIYQEIPE